MKAILRYHEKYQFQNRLIVEFSIYEVSDSKRYPSGVKYALICVDSQTRQRVLMDNHHPKGDHIHIDQNEIGYSFVNVEKLLEDFKKIVLDHFGVKL